MPSFALLLCSVAAVLGTLAVAPLGPDLRLVVFLGLGTLFVAGLSGRLPARLVALVAVALLGASANAALHERAVHDVVEQRTARYTGTVLEASTADDGSSSLTVALDNGLRVLARVHALAPVAGTHIVVRGRLEPFDEARNPGEPSERDIQRERGLDARLDAAAILRARDATGWEARIALARLHDWAHAQLRDRLGEPAASVVAGELWGERSALPPDLRTEFQETGTVHVLVTAGLHLGAVAALCTALLTLLALPRWTTCSIAIALVWVFVWWSGAQLPAVRAATMATA
ncbi:MAG: ComEC/Rec2 family competence protein, partial [Candidatus Cybelea sp.]